ncbi:hypothetical protein M3J09_010488 [Ascochyta lentis]
MRGASPAMRASANAGYCSVLTVHSTAPCRCCRNPQKQTFQRAVLRSKPCHRFILLPRCDSLAGALGFRNRNRKFTNMMWIRDLDVNSVRTTQSRNYLV